MITILGGIHKKRKLKSPPKGIVRPTLALARGAVFNICQMDLPEARFLDLYAGSGAMGLEAISRGASSSTFVENNRQALQTIQQNIALLKEEKRCRVMPLDALKALQNLLSANEQFDIIFADPPYGKGFAEKILQFVDTHPSLLAQSGRLLLEDEFIPSEPLPLSNLVLKSERRLGRANLKEFTKKN